MQREYEVMGRKLQIHLGDITQLQVDAIVSSENSDLIMDRPDGPSVSAAIRRAEGEELALDLARLGPIEPGRAVVTPTRKLPCRWIIHAAAVIKTEDGHHSTLPTLKEAVRSALRLAAGLGLESLAFPAFGVRATHISREQASQAMVEELVAGLEEQTSLRRIVIALLDAESFLAFFEEAMRRGTQANEPLVLRVDHDKDELEFAFQEKSPIAHLATTPFPATKRDELREATSRLRSAAERRLLDQDRELQALGSRLFGLFPDAIYERLKAEAPRQVLLRIDEELAGLPFELAWDGEQFLVERTQVSRLLVIRSETPPPQGAPPPGGGGEGLLLAGQGLRGASREAEFLLDLLWRRGQHRTHLTLLADQRASRRAVVDALGQVDLLHWCGHTESRNGAPWWELADGEGLTPTDVAGLRLPTRLVVANSCGPDVGISMTRAFLLAGARNYVGTLWDVDDEVARIFALHFYEELLLGRTLGEALATTRKILRKADAIHWAAYHHYGDPRERMFESIALTSC